MGNQKIFGDVRIYKPGLDRVRRYAEDFRDRRRGKVYIDSSGHLVLVGYFIKRTRVTSRSERFGLLKLEKRTIYRQKKWNHRTRSGTWSRQ